MDKAALKKLVLIKEADEIVAMTVASIKTQRNKQNKPPVAKNDTERIGKTPLVNQKS